MAKRRDIFTDDILEEAQNLWLAQGYNGFSIRDVGAAVGISSASVHHHFPTKSDLAAAVLTRHRERLNKLLAAIAAEHENWQTRITNVIAVFSPKYSANSLLLALASADYAALSTQAKAEVQLLHENLTGWLARFTSEAIKRDELPSHTAPADVALTLLSTLQGALLLGRISGASVYEYSARGCLSCLGIRL